jgi:hypothetical protein
VPAKFASSDWLIEGNDTATMLASSWSMNEGADTQSNTISAR